MYNVHIEVASLVYIYVYVGSKTIFSPVDSSTIHDVVIRNLNTHVTFVGMSTFVLLSKSLN